MSNFPRKKIRLDLIDMVNNTSSKPLEHRNLEFEVIKNNIYTSVYHKHNDCDLF